MIRRRINYRASLRNYNFHSARLPPSPLEKKKFDASISGQGEEERWIWGASPIGQTARIGEMKNCVDGCFFSNTTTSRRDARCGGGSFGRNERFGGRWPAVAGIRDFREALREGEAHGILVGVGPSLHCSRRLIHCRLPQTAFCPSRLSSPLLRSHFYRRRPSRVLSNVASPNRLRDRSINDRSPILRGWPAFSGSLSSTDDCGLPSTVFAFFSFWSVALEFFFPFSLPQDRFVSPE